MNESDQWTRDFRVLQYVTERITAGAGAQNVAHVAKALDLSEDDTRSAYKNLHRGGFVIGARNERTISHHVFDVTERALLQVGIWPTPETGLDRMIAALEAIADHGNDEDTRTRARKILDGVSGTGKHIGLAMATAYATGQIPT